MSARDRERAEREPVDSTGLKITITRVLGFLWAKLSRPLKTHPRESKTMTERSCSAPADHRNGRGWPSLDHLPKPAEGWNGRYHD